VRNRRTHLSEGQGTRHLRQLLQVLARLLLGPEAPAGVDGPIVLARAAGRAIVAGAMETVTRRELMRSCRAFCDATEPARDAALLFLADASWLSPIDDGRRFAGRVTEFAVHPAVHARFAAEGSALRERRAAVRELFGD
jgi:hypothetical protein